MATDKKYWVSVETLMEATVYDTKEKLSKARRNREIEFKYRGRTIYYNLGAIHPTLFKRQLYGTMERH